MFAPLVLLAMHGKKEEFKLKNKRQANKVEFFDISHQTKGRSYVDHTSREFMDRARKEIAKRVLELDNSEFVEPEKLSEIERDVMRDLMGSHKPGRTPGHGTGVKRSQVTNLSHDLRRLKGEDLRNDMLLAKVESQSKQKEAQKNQMEAQSMQIEAQNKQITTMQQTIIRITSELRLFQTAFREMYSSSSSRDKFSTSSHMQLSPDAEGSV